MSSRRDRSPQVAAIETGLAAVAARLDAVGPGRWRVAFPDAPDRAATARVTGPWFVLTSPVPVNGSTPDAWAFVRFNARHDGPARVARGPGDRAGHVRSDVWIGDGTRLDDAVAEAAADFSAALASVKHPPAVDEDEPDPAPGSAAGLAPVLAEAGWTPADATADPLRLTLDTGAGLVPVDVARTAGGRVRAVAALAAAAGFGDAGRRAAALLLLRASAAVRLVRGFAGPGPGAAFGLAVVGEPGPTPGGVDRALSAIGVAARLVTRELDALRHEALAHRYLAWTEDAKAATVAAAPPAPAA